MYEIQVTRVKLSNFISSFKFLKAKQMLICLFPSMHFYILHLSLLKLWYILASSVPVHHKSQTKNSKDKTKQNIVTMYISLQIRKNNSMLTTS